MTIRNKNELALARASINSNLVLRQVTVYNRGKILVIEKIKFVELLEVLRTQEFEIINLYWVSRTGVNQYKNLSWQDIKKL